MSDTLSTREANAIAWFLSVAAANLTLAESRVIIRERFGLDVDESLRSKFAKVTALSHSFRLTR